MSHRLLPTTIIVFALVSLVLAACREDDDRPAGATATFTSGVAAGAVTANSALLWARAERGDVLLAEVSTDPMFRKGVKRFEGTTSAARDFTAQIQAKGLEPNTMYHYRFRAGGATSQIGRFITAPNDDESQPLRFVFSGDADGRRRPDGSPVFNEFEVIETAAREGPAFFVFFGDTIYGDREPVATTLDGYRAKYRQNREYAALNRMLASAGVFTIWDDHEVVNDFAGTTVDRTLFEAGRRAFREYVPIAGGFDDPLYGSYRWGKEAEVIILDERSYRSESASQTCGADPLATLLLPDAPEHLRPIRAVVGLPAELPDACVSMLADPSRTMLGPEQKRWLKERLTSSDATWKIIVNEVPVQQLLALPYDRWEGYPAERREILEFIRDEGLKNVVFLTTDLHATVFGRVRVDAFSGGDAVAYEAIAGPIATTPLRQDVEEAVGAAAADAFESLLTGLLNVDCAELDSHSYGFVSVDPGTGKLTIASKDASGRVLCETTLLAE